MTDEVPDPPIIREFAALAAVAHPLRFRILDLLAVHGALSTSEIARALGVASGSASHHLGVLTDAGLARRAADAESDRRLRRWELTSRGFTVDARVFPGDRAAEELAAQTEIALFEREAAFARAALATAPNDGVSGHFWLRLTDAEREQLGAELSALLLGWRRRTEAGGEGRTTTLAFYRAFPAEP